MRVLVVGGGGREHALAWCCARSPRVDEVLVAPGNAGSAQEPGVRNVAVAAGDIAGLIDLARRESVDLVIVGPEQPLVDGIADQLTAAGIACFGPNAEASQLEASKSFTKAFLDRHGIPTASFERFTAFDAARDYIERTGAPLVVKADGLAAGKGVVVADSVAMAVEAARAMLVDGQFGDASREIVVEAFLEGEEASFIAITDGNTLLPLATSQDHKARDEGDRGPNTGGMGAYSPAPVVTDAVAEHVMRDIMLPTLEGLAKDGIDYVGFLYAGLMIDSTGQARVLEFNCRLGDPETQPILMRLASDLTVLAEAAIAGTLDTVSIEWDPRASLGVVMAAGGYPGSYDNGAVIRGLDAVGDAAKVFHAGTREEGDDIVTAGGRVLTVCALGATVAEAAEQAYAAADAIDWKDCYRRNDIGYRAIQRERDGS
ncbi:MAG: phosphoribosylamine--glycine ligase, partial [Pseudomonadota bacterium]